MSAFEKRTLAEKRRIKKLLKGNNPPADLYKLIYQSKIIITNTTYTNCIWNKQGLIKYNKYNKNDFRIIKLDEKPR